MSQFTPFDDAQTVIYIPTDEDTGGIDTREVDAYRQGVEIRTNRQRFAGMQPKIWAGNTDHVVNVNTIGQARSFVEYENSLLFDDIRCDFDPISYIEQGPDYPLPILLNEGPQQEEEASIEPITIPFRQQSTEGPFFAHRIAAVIGDGNDFDTVFRNANRTSQFEDYDDPLEIRYFLDEGAALWGDGDTDEKIITPGYTAGTERLLRPFDDTTIDDIPQSLDAASDLLLVLYQMQMNQNEDMRPARTRSANANTFVYGRDSNVYGTDSITFIGRTRGS